MKDLFEVRALSKKSHFCFQCTECGNCCRGIKEQVMIDSFDAYRLAKLLYQSRTVHDSLDELFTKYADPIPLDVYGFPIYVLKTTDNGDSCIFLKNNHCSVYTARPRTCRLYPMTIGPGENGMPFSYYLCMDKPHHFTGAKVPVKKWLRENFKREAQCFLEHEYDLLPHFGAITRKTEEPYTPQEIYLILFYRYYNYDLAQPFWPQYVRNMEALRSELNKLREYKDREA